MHGDEKRNLEQRLQAVEVPLGMEIVAGPEHTFAFDNNILYSWKLNGKPHLEKVIVGITKQEIPRYIKAFMESKRGYNVYQGLYDNLECDSDELTVIAVVTNMKGVPKRTLRYRLSGFTKPVEKKHNLALLSEKHVLQIYTKKDFKKEFRGDTYVMVASDQVGLMTTFGEACGTPQSIVNEFKEEDKRIGGRRVFLRLYFGVDVVCTNDFERIAKNKENVAETLSALDAYLLQK